MTDAICELERIDNVCKCIHCGRTFNSENCEKIVAKCRSVERQGEPRTVAQLILGFGKSTIKHIKNGLPKCTEEEVKARLAICAGCDSYDAERKSCKECGCNCNSKRVFFNKLTWADQECPLKKWLAINKKEGGDAEESSPV